MRKFKYIGQSERIYPNAVTDVLVKPGAVLSFHEPPSDGLWIEVPEAPAKPKAEGKK